MWIVYLIVFLVVIVWPIYSWWKETDAEEKLHEKWRKDAEKRK